MPHRHHHIDAVRAALACGAHVATSAVPSHHNHMITLASYVPDFPRIGEPLRNFISRDVPTSPGINADDLTRIFLPDLIQPSFIYSFLLLVSCGAAFVYLELGSLVNDFVQEQTFERLEEDFLAEESEENRDLRRGAAFQNSRKKALAAVTERRRGLGWLALIAAIAVWSTGIVNTISPFQP